MNSRAIVSAEGSRDITQHWPWLLLALLLLVLATIWWPGCKQYPEVTSPESLTLIKGLYSACSARSVEWLDRVEREVGEAAASGKMTQAEQQSFERVIQIARSGQWDNAQAACLKFAQDQVR